MWILPSLPPRVKLHGVPYARRLTDSAKIRLGTFACPLDCELEEDAFEKKLQRLSEYAQVAAEIGCTRCVMTLAPASQTRPYHENFEFHRHQLGAIAKALEPAGVRLGVGFRAAEYLRKGQTYQFIHDLDALSLLLNMVAASNVGLLLDVWDLYVAGGRSTPSAPCGPARSLRWTWPTCQPACRPPS